MLCLAFFFLSLFFPVELSHMACSTHIYHITQNYNVQKMLFEEKAII